MEIFNLGMTGQAIQSLLQTVQSRWNVWDSAVEGVQNSVQWTAPGTGSSEKYGPGQRLQACINIHALSYDPPYTDTITSTTLDQILTSDQMTQACERIHALCYETTVTNLPGIYRGNIRKTAHLVGFDSNQGLNPDQQSNARANIDAQKEILKYTTCTVMITSTTYTGFAVGAFGADMTSTSNFGFVFGVPNFWDTASFEQNDTKTTPYASGFGAVALGAGIATGRFSVALGGGNSAVQSTDWSTLPVTSLAEGPYSLAGGTHSWARGRHSFAFGNQTFTSDTSTIALGDHAVALKRYSIAMGNGVTANGEGQFVRGRRNYVLGTGWIDIVGYGAGYSGFTTGSRKNIYTLSTEGNLHISGDLYVNDTTDSCVSGGNKVVIQNDLGGYTFGTYMSGGGGDRSAIIGPGWTDNLSGSGNIVLGWNSITSSTLTMGTDAPREGTFKITVPSNVQQGSVKGNAAIVLGTRNIKTNKVSTGVVTGFIIGYQLIGDNYTTVFGRNNMPMYGLSSITDATSSHYLLVVGNGTGNTVRKNAFTINAAGMATFASELYIGATNDACTSNAAFRVPKIFTTTGSTPPSSSLNPLMGDLWISGEIVYGPDDTTYDHGVFVYTGATWTFLNGELQ